MKTFKELTIGDKIYLYGTEDPKLGIIEYNVISNRACMNHDNGDIILTLQGKGNQFTDVVFFESERNNTQIMLMGSIMTTNAIEALQFRYRKTASINMKIRKHGKTVHSS